MRRRTTSLLQILGGIFGWCCVGYVMYGAALVRPPIRVVDGKYILNSGSELPFEIVFRLIAFIVGAFIVRGVLEFAQKGKA